MADIISIRNDLSVVSQNLPNQYYSSSVGPSNPNVEESIANYTNLNTTTNTLVFPSDRPKYFFAINIGKYSRTNMNQINRAAISSESAIVLPLPSQLQDVNETVWQEEELGFALGMAGQAAYGVKNVMDGSKGILDTLGSLAQGVGEGIAAGGTGFATGVLQGLLGVGGNIQSGAAVLSGYSPNQFLTVLFKGPKYKRHELSWKIVPKNHDESMVINKIIKTLNNAMAPELSGGGAFFSFPSIFNLALYPNSKYLFKFKPCVLETFYCNYTPGGVPAFFHQVGNDANPPEAVEFRMRFLELEFWLKGNYNETNDPYDVISTAPVMSGPSPTTEVPNVNNPAESNIP